MGKKSEPPKGPNWKKMLKQSAKYQDQNYEMQQEYMQQQQDQYAQQQELTDEIAGIQIPAMREEAALAKQLRDRYINQGIPFEDAYLDKITNWDTEERRDSEAGRAQADVGAAADASREAELRRLESYGIDPSQTRSAALDSKLGLQTAAAKAGAGNDARRRIENQGIALGGEATNLYRGMPSMSGQALATATGAGQTAYGNQQSTGAQGGNMYTTGANMNAQGFNMMNSGYNTAGNLHQGDLAAWELGQKYGLSNQLGNMAGAVAGAWAGGGFDAEGGPVKPNYAEGGNVSPGGGYAPSGQSQPKEQAPMAQPLPPGQAIPTDSVPANLEQGEWILPKDVVAWEGEKSLQKLINKAREDRTTTESQRAQNQRSLGIPA